MELTTKKKQTLPKREVQFPTTSQSCTSRGKLSVVTPQDSSRIGDTAPRRWEPYDPAWLVRIAEDHRREYPWLPVALSACTRASVESKAMIHFVDPETPDWDFETNIVLSSRSHGDLVLDVLTGGRIGGVEFLNRLS